MARKQDSKAYSADDIVEVDDQEHVRRRVGVYLGSADSRGMTTAVREIIDNSVDEAIEGHGGKIDITFYADGSAEVSDSGRGIPAEDNAQGQNALILSCSHLRAGGKFSDKSYTSSGGLNGMGMSAVNACSTRMDVRVYRDGKQYDISFQAGHPGFFAKPGTPNAKFTPADKPKVKRDSRSAEEKKARPTGTSVRFWPDFGVFIPGSNFDIDDIRFRVKSEAFQDKRLDFTVTDEVNTLEDGSPRIDHYQFDGGLCEMLPTLVPGSDLLTKPVMLHADTTFVQNRTVQRKTLEGFDPSQLGPGETENDWVPGPDIVKPLSIDFAFAYNGLDDDSTVLKSYVNMINTVDGGTHEEGIWLATNRVLRNYIKGTQGLLRKNEDVPALDDVKSGFVGAVSVRIPEPDFTGQEKSKFSSPVKDAVSKAIGDELSAWLSNKSHAAQAKLMGKRIVEAERERLVQKRMKETQKKAARLEGATAMPDKLVECKEPKSPYAELHICEGDSAMSTLKAARDSRYQAIMPIRGKILNVHKSTQAKMLDNKECQGIITALGAGFKSSFNIDDLRYNNVFIATDADDDGLHIACLLITFFWTYMRPMLENGRIYVCEPPLFATKVGGKTPRMEYAIDDEAQEKLLADLKRRKQPIVSISRLKGLGEMTADQFWDTTLNPETRSVRRVTIDDVQAAREKLDLTMGKQVEPRREWIFDEYDQIDRSELDI